MSLDATLDLGPDVVGRLEDEGAALAPVQLDAEQTGSKGVRGSAAGGQMIGMFMAFLYWELRINQVKDHMAHRGIPVLYKNKTNL